MSLTTLNNLISNNLTQGGLGDTITGAELRAVMAAMVDTLSKTVTLSGNAIPFNRLISYCGQSTLSSDIVYTKDTTDATPGMGAILRLVGNGANAPVFTNFKVSNISQAYDSTNGVVNVLVFFFDGQDYWVTVFQEESASVIPTLSAPGSFTATVNSSTQITLTWSDVANESSYTLDRSTSADFSTSLVSVSKAAGSTSHVASGLVAGTHYFFRIRSIGDGVTYLSSPYVYDDDTTTGADVTAPTVVSRNTTSTTNIRIVFSEVVTATNVGHSFKKNGSALVPSAVSGSGTNTLDFTVPTMATGDTLLHSYAQSTGNTLDGASNELANFTDQAVTNNIVGLDTDSEAALNFVATRDSTTFDSTVRNAVSTYFAALKAAGAFTKGLTCNLPLGTGEINLFNPLDTDAAHRWEKNSGSTATVDATGFHFNGTLGYNSNFNPFTDNPDGYQGLHYSFAYKNGVSGFLFGANSGSGSYNWWVVNATPANGDHSISGANANLTGTGSALLGRWGAGARNDGTTRTISARKNGTQVFTQAAAMPATGGSPNEAEHVGNFNNVGTLNNAATVDLTAFVRFKNLSLTEIAAVDTALGNLLTALSL